MRGGLPASPPRFRQGRTGAIFSHTRARASRSHASDPVTVRGSYSRLLELRQPLPETRLRLCLRTTAAPLQSFCRRSPRSSLFSSRRNLCLRLAVCSHKRHLRMRSGRQEQLQLLRGIVGLAPGRDAAGAAGRRTASSGSAVIGFLPPPAFGLAALWSLSLSPLESLARQKHRHSNNKTCAPPSSPPHSPSLPHPAQPSPLPPTSPPSRSASSSEPPPSLSASCRTDNQGRTLSKRLSERNLHVRTA